MSAVVVRAVVFSGVLFTWSLVPSQERTGWARTLGVHQTEIIGNFGNIICYNRMPLLSSNEQHLCSEGGIFAVVDVIRHEPKQKQHWKHDVQLS